MKILFKYPTFRRPKWFIQTLQKYYDMLSGENECSFLITLNEDDETMNNDDMKSFMDQFPYLTYIYGNHKNKIAAVNADMDRLEFDILYLISDDMIPVISGFDKIIVKGMETNFKDIS